MNCEFFMKNPQRDSNAKKDTNRNPIPVVLFPCLARYWHQLPADASSSLEPGSWVLVEILN